jgi:ubiquinone/menaquinone biosynthesis C-methylase UbiE
MERFPNEIVDHYDREIDEEQRITQGLGQLELLRTREVLRRHLPAAPQRILDVGGGTGVHAAWLADDGHHVHLIDRVPRHVEQARRRTAPHGSITAELGDARNLRAGRASFDAVLVFGPLYHLTERDDRIGALREAARVLGPDGIVFAAAISRFGSLFDGLAREFLFDPDFRPIVERDLQEGQHRNPHRRPHWFTTAYFHHPDELRAELEHADLEVVELVGVEGLAGWLPHLSQRWQNTSDRELIVWSARVVEAEPSLLGLSAHLLAVARRRGRA